MARRTGKPHRKCRRSSHYRYRSPFRFASRQRLVRFARDTGLTARNRSYMPDLVAVYRRQSYSPLQHLNNDRAILADTATELAWRGWRVTNTTEEDIERGVLPAGTLSLNMCQGSLATEQLMPLEGDGALVVNGPTSVLNCHRHRLVKRMAEGGVAFPRTFIHASAASPPSPDQLCALAADGRRLWVKRGDVHAERREDVVTASVDELGHVMQAFAQRGVAWVALQEHVPGPVVK